MSISMVKKAKADFRCVTAQALARPVLHVHIGNLGLAQFWVLVAAGRWKKNLKFYPEPETMFRMEGRLISQ